MNRIKVLDLFSGIGGFSLGLERAGMQTVAFCEIEPYCRAVLAKHWPEVPCYDDIKTLNAGRLAADGIHADIICGGFPCQDISTAGKGAGIKGKRSGLWSEYARLIGEIRPHYAIVENVAALRGRGLGRILGDLAALGYDAEWNCIPASAVGAPHRRDRIWIVAYPNSQWQSQPQGCQRNERRWIGNGGEEAADTYQVNVQWMFSGFIDQEIRRIQEQRQTGLCSDGDKWWTVEPNVGRVAHGVPALVHRLKAIGNAVVPQIPEIIGKAILAHEAKE